MINKHPYAKRFFIAYSIILLLSLIPQLFQNQNELFLLVNSRHNGLLDVFFYYITFFGDGLAFAAVILIMLFISYGKSLNGLIIFLSTSLVAQLLKRLLFNDKVRPFGVLSEQYQLHIPDGVSPITTLSFPSGHTVTAFALATFLVMVYPKRNYWLILLALAWLTAYSRVYLTHHFPIDVWVGSIIGTFGGYIMFYLFGAKIAARFGSKSFLNR